MEYPILGTEPLPVEFANTLYGGVDCLSTPELAAGWFAEIALAALAAGCARALRDAEHGLLDARSKGLPLDEAQVETVNAHAAAAPTALRLEPAGDGWESRWAETATGPAAVLGRIATCAVELLAGGAPLRRCAAPDCGVLFVPQHARRRFCHPTCSGRTRQARYHRRRTEDPA
ncbi:hypothetical protein GCM10023148_48990 [Actinokineospora soli]